MATAFVVYGPYGYRLTSEYLETSPASVAWLPLPGTGPSQCPSTTQLLETPGEIYGEAGLSAQRRALQRDLNTLVKFEMIEAVNPGSKLLRFRQRRDHLLDDELIWSYTLEQIKTLAEDTLPRKQWDVLWDYLLNNSTGPILNRSQFRVIPDTLRLQPVAVRPAILSAVIQGLARDHVLQIHFENAAQKRSRVKIHPHALIQRGLIP